MLHIKNKKQTSYGRAIQSLSQRYQNEVFWDVTTFSAVNRYKSFEGTQCHILKD